MNATRHLVGLAFVVMIANGTGRAAEPKKFDVFVDNPFFARLQAIVVSASPRHLEVVNAQTRLSVAEVERVRSSLESATAVPVGLANMQPAGTPYLSAQQHRAKASTNVAAFVVLAQAPLTEVPDLVLAVDSRWVIVNVDALDAKGELLMDRAAKQALRGVGMLFGAGFSADPHAVMKPVQSAPAELDGLGRTFSPDSTQAFNRWAMELGLVPSGQMPYPAKVARGLMPPINPDRWQAWDKEHGRNAETVLRDKGFDPKEVAAEFHKLVKEGKIVPRTGVDTPTAGMK